MSAASLFLQCSVQRMVVSQLFHLRRTPESNPTQSGTSPKEAEENSMQFCRRNQNPSRPATSVTPRYKSWPVTSCGRSPTAPLPTDRRSQTRTIHRGPLYPVTPTVCDGNRTKRYGRSPTEPLLPDRRSQNHTTNHVRSEKWKPSVVVVDECKNRRTTVEECNSDIPTTAAHQAGFGSTGTEILLSGNLLPPAHDAHTRTLFRSQTMTTLSQRRTGQAPPAGG